MNSFNHYGLGSIGDWLYDEVGGLAPADAGLQDASCVKPSTGAELEQRVDRGEDAATATRRRSGRATPPAA